jgi:hypothetical protein
MTRQRAREAKWILVAPLIAALPVGLWITFIALDHNPQGVFDDGEHFYFGAVFDVFFVWFAPVYLFVLLIGLASYGPYRLGLKYGFVAYSLPADHQDASPPGEVRVIALLAAAAALIAVGYAALWMR